MMSKPRQVDAVHDNVTTFAPSARVIADSTNALTGDRLVTVEVTMHRWAMADLALHREVRITVQPLLDQSVAENITLAEDNDVSPSYWPSNTVSAACSPPLHVSKAGHARQIWDYARRRAIESAHAMVDVGVHRSVINRLLEPFLPQTLVVSSSSWDSFIDRRSKVTYQTDPLVRAELTEAAAAIRKAIRESKSETLTLGQWHLPYLRDHELKTLPNDQAHMISVVRCDLGSPDEETFNLQHEMDHYQRLITTIRIDDPAHHVCTPAARGERSRLGLTGWTPHTRPRAARSLR